MNGKLFITVLKDSLKRNRISLITAVLVPIVNFCVFYFYNVENEAVLYSEILVVLLLAILFSIDVSKNYKSTLKRRALAENAIVEWQNLSESESLEASDYIDVIHKLGSTIREINEAYSNGKSEINDYYISWVHQIKTPISVMSLKLQSENADYGELKNELFRIEQYVDMVLSFQRLNLGSNDLVINEYELDGIIRDTIRKYSMQFISKKLSVEYTGTDKHVYTDRKWLICILEQILSNSIKYTPKGIIQISVNNNGNVVIKDPGIGIAKEDIPRIFEKGYTGINGRLGEKSSGLGLYLAKKAADKLNIKISVESERGEGSTFTLSFQSS